ncbi:MAG: cysteine hydrolase [Alphaproteobacteria bacterium]|nr:cysteine hydrolase [Alphaproteobacteria bacterium]
MKRSEINALPVTGDVSFRQRAIEPKRTALILIDLQKGEYTPEKVKAEPQEKYFWDRLANTVIPNTQRLMAACRGAGVEVMFTTVECLTLDGRDRGLDYKVSGFFVPKGAWEAQVLDELKPLPNEIQIPKSSSSVFVSTNIDYILRNLGIEYVILVGIVTDQCVDSAVRDFCDANYMVTLVTDCCATHTQERHDASIRAIKGYCRQRTTDQLLTEIDGLRRQAAE